VIRRCLLPILAVALMLAACGTPSPSPTPALDARQVVTMGMQATAGLKSFHLSATATGTLQIPQLGGSGLNLKGTTAEGDVDLAGRRVALHFAVPPLLNVEGDLLVVDDVAFIRTSLTGAKWMKQAASASGAGSPVPDPGSLVDDVAAFLDKEGVEARKLNDAACGDSTCYQVELTVPSALLDDAASAAGATASGLLTEPLIVNLEFDRQTLYLTSASASIESAASGAFTLDLALSNFDATTSITPPPSDQVDESGGGFSLP
jgi:hypothetical protein